MTDVDYEQEFLGPEPFGPRLPYVRLVNPGDFVTGYVVAYDWTAPLMVFGTTDRAVTAEGKEKTRDIVTIMLSGQSQCMVSFPKELDQTSATVKPGEEGMVAQVHIQGHNRYDKLRPDSFKQAERAHGRIATGDVFTMRFVGTSDIGYNNRRLTIPRNVMGFELRRAGREDAPFVERAAAERRELLANGSLIIPTTPAAAPSGPAPTTQVQPPRADESDLF